MINDNKFKIIILVLSCVLLLSFCAALLYGTVDLPYEVVYRTVLNEFLSNEKFIYGTVEPIHDIVWLLRMPRILLAACIGAGLSICGIVIQAIVKNPLVDPYILGISSGASLGATAAILIGIGAALGENFIGIAAFVGAFVNSLAVVFIANFGGRANSIKLLLAGMALSAVCTSFSSFIVYFSNNMEGMQTIVYWLMGSLSGAKWEVLYVMCPLVICGIIFFSSQYRILNLMLIGDETAVTLGYNLHIYRQGYLLVTSIIVGFTVYSAGMIGFIGLLIPHVVRIIIGTDHKVLLPVAALTGASFMIWADVFCRIIIPGTELPIGILISMIGAPCFVYLMVKSSYNFGGIT